MRAIRGRHRFGLHLGRVTADFRLGQFHDDLLANGSLPLSIVEWILLDDSSDIEKATGMKRLASK